MNVNRPGASTILKELGLQIAPNTLAKKACDGSGPPYRIWNGEAIYDTEDLLKWATAKLGPKLRSTAERKAKGAQTNAGRA